MKDATPIGRLHARVAAIGASLVLAATPASTSASSTTAADRSMQSSAVVRLELLEQQFATDPNGDVRLRYQLSGLDGDPLQLIPPPAAEPTVTDAIPGAAPVVPPPPEPIALTFEVTNYLPLTDADDVDDLVGSDVDPDAFRDLTGDDAVDGVAFDARPLLSRNDDGTVDITLDIGTDVLDSVETRLKMDRPGIYPLRVQLLVGDPTDRNIVATAGTLIQRLAGVDDTDVEVAPPIDLAIVTVTPGAPPGADEAATDRSRRQLEASIDLAAQLDAPVTLEVPPTLVAEAAATPAGSKRLSDSLADDEFVALPLLPLDVSSAVAAGRADAYTRLVSAGEDVLTEAVPTTPSRREVWVTTDPLSAGGAQHLRDLGTRFVVIGAELYAETISEDPPPTDRFVEAELPDGGTLPFLVVDPLSEQLTTDAAERILRGSTSTEWGVETLAEMLVEQSAENAAAVTASEGRVALPRRSRVLTTPDFTSPDPRLLEALGELVETTPSVRFTPASALTGVTDVALDDGQPITVQLPAVAGPSLDARIERIEATAGELTSAASMLSPDDPRPAEWSAQLDSLISTGYSDADVEAATAALLAEATDLKQAVELPEPFAFTLTGRRGEIEIRIRNTIDEPLDVNVGLDASKITFPDGDQRVTLRPLDETSVIIPVEAEANGTSSINLIVSTPAGESLGEPVTLTARVTALTGLGQVLTGGLVLVLVTWWFTHWRNRRRDALANGGRGRHPSNGNGNGNGNVQSDAL
jgi:hypothetical protein